MRTLVSSLISILMLSLITVQSVSAQIERRRDVNSTEFGYLVAPLPFRLEGVGTGLGIAAYFNNLAGTTADVFGVGIVGDITGLIVGTSDIPVFTEHLLFDAVNLYFSAGQGKLYTKRGMDSDKKDFNVLEFGATNIVGTRATLNFYKRMLELVFLRYEGSSVAKTIRNADGDVISEFDSGTKNKFSLQNIGINIDYTDDRTDPRKGVRLNVKRADSPNSESDSAKSFVMDYNLTGYIPVLSYSTLALNYFRSDAHVERKGEDNLDVLRKNSGITCPDENDIQSACYTSRENLVRDTYFRNTKGTATSLGGNSRLRSFPEGRYSGAFSEFYATELRWNLTDERTPYDFFFTRDLRTGIQLATFYETGSVAESRSDLFKLSKSSYGLGIRLVTASGFIYRIDVSNGDEGTGFIVFFDYPWGNVS